MADHDPKDETVLRQPVATISAEEIAEMRRVHGDASRGVWKACRKSGTVMSRTGPLDGTKVATMEAHRYAEDCVFIAMAHERFPALLDAIEALTSENARLTEFALNASVGHGWKDRAERAEAEVERLTEQLAAKQSALDIVWAENGNLSRIEQAAAEYVETAVALTRPHTDMDRTRAAFRNQPGAIGRLIAAVQANKDREWYATHRAKVEADHAAAKEDADEAEGLRPLTDDEIKAGSYLLTRAKDGD